MKNVLAAIGMIAVTTACGTQQPSSSTQSAQADHMWQCSGYNITDAAMSVDRYEVTIDRSGFDESPNVPVKIVVRNRFDSNTAQPSQWQTVLTASSRLVQKDGGFEVKFPGGDLKAAVGNSGITGISPRYQGVLTLKGISVNVSCPVRR